MSELIFSIIYSMIFGYCVGIGTDSTPFGFAAFIFMDFLYSIKFDLIKHEKDLGE